MNNYRTIFILLLLPAFLACNKEEVKVDKASALKFESKLDSFYKQSGFPGFSVGVISNGKIAFQRGFGYANLEKKTPYATKTIQPIASVSKTFISIALMKAIEEGYFTLETNINDLLPFKVKHPSFSSHQIKVRHLVTHTSGIKDDMAIYAKTYLFGEKKPTMQLGVFLKKYLCPDGEFYTPANFTSNAPGSKFEYSNIASALAAYIIEIKAGMQYAEYTRKVIFEPLGMKQTHWFYQDSKENEYAALYKTTREAYPVYTCITYPDGYINTSCQDLSKYLLEMIKGYNGQSSLLKPESFNTIFSIRFTEQPVDSTEKLNIGVFWFITNDLYYHSGADPGVRANVVFNPKTEKGKLVLVNMGAIDSIDESLVFEQQYENLLKIVDEYGAE